MDVFAAVLPEKVKTSAALRQFDYRPSAVAAIAGVGGKVVTLEEANSIVWVDPSDAAPLPGILDANPEIKWVQLPFAGVENFAATGLFDRDVIFTCAKGAYGGQVGEHAFALLLACLRNFTITARTKTWMPTEIAGVEGKRVTVLGGGGIARQLIRYLKAGDAHTTVLRKNVSAMDDVERVLPMNALHDVLPETDALVLALALTPETKGVVGERELSLLPDGAVLVNVARGGHVDTDALVDSLKSGKLKAAGLDVTDPEPLPDQHPLWQMDNVLITSHCSDSVEYVVRKFSERVAANVKALFEESELVGRVDPSVGY